jgi:hypothetical protein
VHTRATTRTGPKEEIEETGTVLSDEAAMIGSLHMELKYNQTPYLYKASNCSPYSDMFVLQSQTRHVEK